MVISIILQSCGGKKTYLKSTAEQLQKEYKLTYGAIIISYDLAKLNKDPCIFAKDFGRIINEATYNKYFLRKFKFSSYKNVNKQSSIKLFRTKNLLLNLNNKYQFLSHEQLYHLKKQNSSNALSDLAKLDKVYPLFLYCYQNPMLELPDIMVCVNIQEKDVTNFIVELI